MTFSSGGLTEQLAAQPGPHGQVVDPEGSVGRQERYGEEV